MTEVKANKAIMQIGREAFLQESGAALIKKYAYVEDELFTKAGFKNSAEDLLKRMTNPYLGDTIGRVVRDVVRKLQIEGRIFGTMRLALQHGIEPKNMALGAMAGIAVLLKEAEENSLPNDLHFADWRQLDNARIERIIDWLWTGQTSRYARQLIKYAQDAQEPLTKLAAGCTDSAQ
jgi:mannitol-1-phosphate/altronate dehydrogenase